MSRTFLATTATGLLALCLGASPRADTAAAQTREQQASFLLTARVISQRDTDKGVTRPRRVTLTDGTLTHDAAFSTVEQHEAIMRFRTGRTELDFVDSYRYTLAAYRVAEMLGLESLMPVTVEREIDHTKGALSWWIDDVRWDEAQRLKEHAQPPDREAWNQQMFRMRLFTQLVGDTDRNAGNMLISSEWKLWMIDFTRAFRRHKKVLAPDDITRCDRQLVDRLRALTAASVAERTKPYIGGSEIEALMARRNALLELVDRLVADKGEAQVLY